MRVAMVLFCSTPMVTSLHNADGHQRSEAEPGAVISWLFILSYRAFEDCACRKGVEYYPVSKMNHL